MKKKAVIWLVVACLITGILIMPVLAGMDAIDTSGFNEADDFASTDVINEQVSATIEPSIKPTDTGHFDLLIITPQEFTGALAPLKAHKDYTDIPTEIVTLESIYASYPGRDQPEKVKRAIAYHREQYGVEYVMLVGDCDKFPVRYIKTYNTQWGTIFFPSDLYYADLYDASSNFDTWDSDNDGYYGEMDFNGFAEANLAKLNLDNINMYPDVMVGRIPASTATEVTTYVNKVIRYEFEAYNADWSKKALWVVDNEFGVPSDKNRLDGYLSGFTIEKPYEDPRWTTGISDPYLRRDFRASEINRIINDGVGFVNYFGHGGTTAWSWVYDQHDSYHDMDVLTNSDKLPVVYAVSCLTGRFYFDQAVSNGFTYDLYRDFNNNEWKSPLNVAVRPEPMATQPSQYDRDSLAEQFLVKRDTGAVAYIGSTEKHEYGGKDLDKYFFEAYSVSGKPPALGYMWDYARTKWIENSDLTSNYAFIHMHKVMLFGDPSLRVGGISRIQLNDFTGTYRMDHDGWKGTLNLNANPDGYIKNQPDITGTYTGDDGLVYNAHGYVRTWKFPITDSWGPDHKIELHIEFQEESVFEGYLWTGSKDKIAGLTSWQTIPFGFYAVKQGSATQADLLELSGSAGISAGSTPQAIVKQDFTGVYTMDHNGWKGVLKLWGVPDDPIEQLPNIRGTYTGLDGIVYDVRGFVRTPTYPVPSEWGPDHKIELYINFAEETKFEGYLWTGAKNKIAGKTYWQDTPYGFYAIRALPVIPGCTNPPTDPDGDGIYEDLNGNGRLDFADVVLYFNQMEWIAANEPVSAFDLNGNRRIDFADIVKLFGEI